MFFTFSLISRLTIRFSAVQDGQKGCSFAQVDRKASREGETRWRGRIGPTLTPPNRKEHLSTKDMDSLFTSYAGEKESDVKEPDSKIKMMEVCFKLYLYLLT